MTDYSNSPMYNVLDSGAGGVVQDEEGNLYIVADYGDWYIEWPGGLACYKIYIYQDFNDNGRPVLGYELVTWPDLHDNHTLYPLARVLPPPPPEDPEEGTLYRLPDDVKKLDGPTTDDGTLTFVYLKNSYVVSPPPPPVENGDPYAYELPPSVDYPTPGPILPPDPS